MASLSLDLWSTRRMAALDEIEGAHRHVGGSGPGRRYATQQINQAYAVLLASQFQGFCRDLHSECVDYLSRMIANPTIGKMTNDALRRGRRLDTGNPNPATLGADYNRMGLQFWTEVEAVDARNAQRQRALETLVNWRNAIAHQDFDSAKLGGRTTLTVQEVRGWRSACDGLAQSFDAVLRSHLHTVTGSPPW